MMEVILLERIENLGQMGDVVRVRPGFALNYLLPKRKALRATKDNMTRFESQRAQLEAQNLKRRQEAEAVGSKLDGLKVVLRTGTTTTVTVVMLRDGTRKAGKKETIDELWVLTAHIVRPADKKPAAAPKPASGTQSPMTAGQPTAVVARREPGRGPCDVLEDGRIRDPVPIVKKPVGGCTRL